MKKIILCLIAILFNIQCNKMKNKIFPQRPYEKAEIDQFYWAVEGWDYAIVPIIKPFKLTQMQHQKSWLLNASEIPNELGDIAPLSSFNVSNQFIYGKQDERPNFDETEVIPQKWFIINAENKQITHFEKEEDFQKELKKLNLPDESLNPDEVFEQYKKDPVLPWFPEDIKKQLEEVKAKK